LLCAYWWWRGMRCCPPALLLLFRVRLVLQCSRQRIQRICC
jgi:hypothetical protein